MGQGYAVSDDETSPDAIILRSFKMHDMQLPAGLLCVARAGAGVNNIPIDKCTEAGVVVFNTPGANANAVKELLIAGLVLSARKVWQGINWAQGLKGKEDVAGLVEKGKGDFGGGEIMGKTIGIIGVGGAIGLLAANACHALGMKVVGSDPFISDKAKAALNPAVRIAELDEVLAQSDYIAVSVPYTDATKHMLNAETLKKCKKGAVILNMARAELVNDEAIKAALDDGSISLYVTDFPNENLLDHHKIITIPHLGASTDEAEENCAVMAAAQIKDYLEKGNIVNSVNFPAITLDGPGKRICVIYNAAKSDAVPQKVAQAIKAKGLNATSLNGVRGTTGYSLTVTDGNDCAGVCDDIRNIPGVVSVRAI